MTIIPALALTLCLGSPLPEDKPASDPVADLKLAEEAARLNREGVEAYQRGRAAEAVDKMRQAVTIRRQLFPKNRFPQGHAELAASLGNLGALLSATGRADLAVEPLDEALAMTRRLNPPSNHPDGHPDILRLLSNLGEILRASSQFERADAVLREALSMGRMLYPTSTHPDGHADLTTAINNLAMLHRELGQLPEAFALHEECFAMQQKLFRPNEFPDGHPHLATSLNNIGFTLEAMGQYERALRFYEQGLAMRRRLYPKDRFPDGHPTLASSLGNIGSVLEGMGQAERGIPYFEQALTVAKGLYPPSRYPDGHPEIARALNNLGYIHRAAGQPRKALPFLEQSLAMYRRLLPRSRFERGHPLLASSMMNLGQVLDQAGDATNAVAMMEQAAEMTRQLFPSGHPLLSHILLNWARSDQRRGDAEAAALHAQQAIDVARQIYPAAQYPHGHPELARGLLYQGQYLLGAGHIDRSRAVVREALAMQQRIERRELLAASESAAFDLIAGQASFRDALLTVNAGVEAEVGATYAAFWPSRAAATRVLERRHAAARTPGMEEQVRQLRTNRVRTERLLQQRATSSPDRDQQLARLADDRERIERELAAKIPLLQRWQQIDAQGPRDLARVLPPGSAFVDFVMYREWEFRRSAEKSARRFVAFVVTRDVPGQRVDLGDAEPIEAAIRAWRQAIEAGRDDTASAEFVRLVWQPLSRALPPGVTALYLAPDGDLARVPWAAIPLEGGRRLVEQCATAHVLHGEALLEQLTRPATDRQAWETIALGGLNYGAGTWPALDGTQREIEAIRTLAPGRVTVLTGGEATAARLAELLPRATHAHIATHGEFQADALIAERRRAEAARDTRQFGDGSRLVAARNPLGFVGLVLSGGQVMSALSVLDLNLSRLDLVTLSACETGLGQQTGGEGVQGLLRAFHLAGARNVVASLWKVEDAATAALMAKFYHELWVEKKPPIQAIRAAQLAVFHHPELIPDLAGERGAPRLKQAVAVPVGKQLPAAGASRTAVKRWAAFVLSGTGQ